MATQDYYEGYDYPTQVVSTSSGLMLVFGWACGVSRSTWEVQKETSEQKKARIAKEKMLASWNIHHKYPQNITQTVQICKPAFRIGHMRR